jgi:hypothetical protein
MIWVVSVCGQKSKDGFTDEERPYEFGFNIEGYQHRHEKKGNRFIDISNIVTMSALSRIQLASK